MKMKNNINGTKVVKSFMLAGVLSIGVLTGGHFTQAAGPEKVKVEQSHKAKPAKVQVVNKKANVKATPAKPAVKVQPKAAAKGEAQEKASKSQAGIHASETAKKHAAPNAAVHTTNQQPPVKELPTEEVPTEETVTQEPVVEETVEVVELEPIVTDETDVDSESEEVAETDA
ncbi:MAG: hypothetical protein AB2411_03590, partial [Mesobacillus sp.]